MANHFLAWWNTENFFDAEDYPNRTEKLARTLKNELKGWDEEILERKLAQLSSVINRMNGGKGPDILGLCEVENRHILELLIQKLPNRPYQIVHTDTQDGRGIDVAFLYDSSRYEAKETFFHVILKRNATRDLVQVNFVDKEPKREFILIGNHWPSRSEGQLESEPYRMAAGETLAYYHERINEVKNDENIAVIAMGDFNDEPFDRSLTDYALASNCREKVINANDPLFYNLMWPLVADGLGTYYLDRPNVLDQFLVSKGILTEKSGFRLVEGSVQREIYPGMADNSPYHRPIRFSRPSEKLNKEGYSDHFPISFQLQDV